MTTKKTDLRYAAFIAGEWVKGTKEFQSINPADSRDVVAVFAEADKVTVREAAQTDRQTFKAWSKTPAPVRAGIIGNYGKLVERNKVALAKVLSREIGKPYREALGEIQEAVDTADFFVSEGRRLYGQTVPSEMPNKELYTYRRPIGVFGCMTACNFP